MCAYLFWRCLYGNCTRGFFTMTTTSFYCPGKFYPASRVGHFLHHSRHPPLPIPGILLHDTPPNVLLDHITLSLHWPASSFYFQLQHTLSTLPNLFERVPRTKETNFWTFMGYPGIFQVSNLCVLISVYRCLHVCVVRGRWVKICSMWSPFTPSWCHCRNLLVLGLIFFVLGDQMMWAAKIVCVCIHVCLHALVCVCTAVILYFMSI